MLRIWSLHLHCKHNDCRQDKGLVGNCISSVRFVVDHVRDMTVALCGRQRMSGDWPFIGREQTELVCNQYQMTNRTQTKAPKEFQLVENNRLFLFLWRLCWECLGRWPLICVDVCHGGSFFGCVGEQLSSFVFSFCPCVVCLSVCLVECKIQTNNESNENMQHEPPQRSVHT